MSYQPGDAVEVLVLTKRGKQPEWIPATVTVVSDRIDVTFEGGSQQRFALDTDRLRTPGAAREEGAQWDFSTF